MCTLSTSKKVLNLDLILPAGVARSVISIMLRTYTHDNRTSHSIIYINPKPNQKKNLKFGPRLPSSSINIDFSSKGRLTADLVLGLGILDSALYLTQYSIITQRATPEVRLGPKKYFI